MFISNESNIVSGAMQGPKTPARPVMDSILEAIGSTPMVCMDRIAKEHGLKCNLLGKVEFFNAGGSVKDRVAKQMIEEAEREGRLTPGKSVVIEPTSGNSGISLALTCALKGYECIITLPEKMSLEKELTIRALGAHIVRTPSSAPCTSPESNFMVAKMLADSIPGGVVLDQFSNPNNPKAHEFGTGPEIIEQVQDMELRGERTSSGKVDAFFAGTGTGGSLTGCTRAIKKHNQDAIIVAIDPKGSLIARPSSLNELEPGRPSGFQIEGIGLDFSPKTLSYEGINEWIKTEDDESFKAVRQLMLLEGLLVGGTSGSALAGALRWLKSEEGMREVGGVEGKNVVVLFPDGIRNYMSKPWFKEALDADGPSDLAIEVEKLLGRPLSAPKPYTKPTLDA